MTKKKLKRKKYENQKEESEIIKRLKHQRDWKSLFRFAIIVAKDFYMFVISRSMRCCSIYKQISFWCCCFGVTASYVIAAKDGVKNNLFEATGKATVFYLWWMAKGKKVSTKKFFFSALCSQSPQTIIDKFFYSGLALRLPTSPENKNSYSFLGPKIGLTIDWNWAWNCVCKEKSWPGRTKKKREEKLGKCQLLLSETMIRFFFYSIMGRPFSAFF